MERHRAPKNHSEARRVIGDLCHVLGVNFDEVDSMLITKGRICVTLRPVSLVGVGAETETRSFSIPYF